MRLTERLCHSHAIVLDAVDSLPVTHWETPGACGRWSPKEILAHLSAFEEILVEVLLEIQAANQPTMLVRAFAADRERFNTTAVALRRHLSPKVILSEYTHAHKTALALLANFPDAVQQQPGLLGWFGPHDALEDFLFTTYVRHKQEHAAQIAAFAKRERFNQNSAPTVQILLHP